VRSPCLGVPADRFARSARDGDEERLTGHLVRRPHKVLVIWLGRGSLVRPPGPRPVAGRAPRLGRAPRRARSECPDPVCRPSGSETPPVASDRVGRERGSRSAAPAEVRGCLSVCVAVASATADKIRAARVIGRHMVLMNWRRPPGCEHVWHRGAAGSSLELRRLSRQARSGCAFAAARAAVRGAAGDACVGASRRWKDGLAAVLDRGCGFGATRRLGFGRAWRARPSAILLLGARLVAPDGCRVGAGAGSDRCTQSRRLERPRARDGGSDRARGSALAGDRRLARARGAERARPARVATEASSNAAAIRAVDAR